MACGDILAAMLSITPSNLTLEIAAAAAVFVADHGLDYGSAKRKAVQQHFGNGKVPRDAMPDNEQIDDALLEHLSLFDDEHDARVQRMRLVAAALMQKLANFSPMLTGSVWKGIVAEHVPIHLQLFTDSQKEVLFSLLDLKIEPDAAEITHYKTGKMIEGLTFEWRGEPIMIGLYPFDDLRGALKETFRSGHLTDRKVRASLADLEALMSKS